MEGDLSVSRSIGDLPYVQHGLIATPSLSKWLDLYTSSGQQGLPLLLILASDGLFERFSPFDICTAAVAIASGIALPQPKF